MSLPHIYLRMCHSVKHPLDSVNLDEIPRRVKHESSVRKLRGIIDGGLGHHNEGVPDVVVLNQLEKCVNSMFGAKVGGG